MKLKSVEELANETKCKRIRVQEYCGHCQKHTIFKREVDACGAPYYQCQQVNCDYKMRPSK